MALTARQKAEFLRKLGEIEQKLAELQKDRLFKERAAKNWAAMTPARRWELIRKAMIIEQDMVKLQAQELLRSRARKTAPAACSGPVCGHMRTPAGGRR